MRKSVHLVGHSHVCIKTIDLAGNWTTISQTYSMQLNSGGPPSDAASYPREYIPLNHTDVIISEFANPGILDSIWFTCNVGIYVRGIVNTQGRPGIYTWNDSVFCKEWIVVGTKCYLSETEHCHTTKYRCGHFKNSHSWLNFELLHFFCFEQGALDHQRILMLIVLIFCVDFLRIMSVAIVLELWQIWEVKDARSPKALLPMFRGGHYKMLYFVYVALRWTVDMKNTHTLHRVKVDSGHEHTHLTPC